MESISKNFNKLNNCVSQFEKKSFLYPSMHKIETLVTEILSKFQNLSDEDKAKLQGFITRVQALDVPTDLMYKICSAVRNFFHGGCQISKCEESSAIKERIALYKEECYIMEMNTFDGEEKVKGTLQGDFARGNILTIHTKDINWVSKGKDPKEAATEAVEILKKAFPDNEGHIHLLYGKVRSRDLLTS